jgi:membrane-bound lytic murein transglycosylase D
MEKNDKSNKSYSVLFLFLALFSVFLIENSSYSPSNLPSDQADTAEEKPQQVVSNFAKIATTDIVNDVENRVSDSFAIPAGLENRVGFWIDVYSEYTSENKIIHHLDYPWIQYEIFNVSEILARPAKFSWTNPEKADKETKLRLQYVRAKLSSLYKKLKKNQLDKLDLDESKYLEALQKLPGSLLKNVKYAASSVRVQTGQKDHFQKGLGIANRYLPHMEEIFIDHGLPPEISRLPLVESSFNKTATSKVGAAGLWQFMDNTGKKFLVINSFIDERRSPLKSTEAAAELIKENYLIMGRSWPLAITAWNHGPVGLKRAIKELKTKDIVKIIKHFESKHFSFASENFYSEFLAALYVEKYSDKIFESINAEPTLIFDSYKLTQRLKPKKIFEFINITEDEFIDLNPDLKKAVKMNLPLPKGLIIFVHPDKIEDLVKLSNQKVARNKEI